jgi:hypothetical protein
MRWLLCVTALMACRREAKPEQKPAPTPEPPPPALGSKVTVNACGDGACEIARGSHIRVGSDGAVLFFTKSYTFQKFEIVELEPTAKSGRVVGTTNDEPSHLCSDEGAVYFTAPGQHITNEGFIHSKVQRLDRKTGEITTIASEQDYATDIALDATHVYWVNYGDKRSGVSRVKKSGGEPEVIAKLKGTKSVAVTDKSVVYGSAFEGYGTFRVSKDGGEPDKIHEKGANLIAVHDEIFGTIWHGYFDTEILRIRDTGKALSLGKVEDSGALAIDDKRLYLADSGSKKLIAFPRDGGKTEILFEGAGSADGLAIAGDYLFWTTGEQLGRIKRPK